MALSLRNDNSTIGVADNKKLSEILSQNENKNLLNQWLVNISEYYYDLGKKLRK